MLHVDPSQQWLSAQTQPSQRCQIFVIMNPPNTKIHQNSKPSLNARILFFYSIIKQSISHHPAFFASQHFTLPADTFTRRTSGHSLATFVAVHSAPPDHQHHVSHCNPSLFSFVFCIKKDNWASVFWILHTGFLNNFSISHRPASGDRGRPVCLDTIGESVHNFKFYSQPLLLLLFNGVKTETLVGVMPYNI